MIKRLTTLCIIVLLSNASASQEIIHNNLRVIYDDPNLSAYAQQVATDAQQALELLVPLFGTVDSVVLRITDDTDVFNAYAPPLPRPMVVLEALFPVEGEVGLRAESVLFNVLLHELTHTAQLTFTEKPDGSEGGRRFGLIGEGVAAVPPGWFLEGIATWVESELGTGGRRDDALTRGIIQSVALDGHWPELHEVSRINYDTWPAGNTRYLFGAVFVEYLVERFGFEMIQDTLRYYNSGGRFRSFSTAWQRAAINNQLADTNLNTLWQDWYAYERTKALARTSNQPTPDLLTDPGQTRQTPAINSSGTQIAWQQNGDIILADFNGQTLTNPRTLISRRYPYALEWLSDSELVYARIVRRPGSAFLELFSLDVTSGVEQQLTSGERAHFPQVMPDGCVLYVRDVLTEGSSLRRWCDGVVDTVLVLAPEQHIVGLSVSDGGQVALSVWRQGFVDIALLQGGALQFLTQDAAQDVELVWLNETQLVFRSDRDEAGVFNLYRLSLDSEVLEQLTDARGGAFAPAVHGNTVIYSELTGNGYALAALDATTVISQQSLRAELMPEPKRVPDVTEFTVRPYVAFRSLEPYAWYPSDYGFDVSPFGVGLALSAAGQDNTGAHSYTLTAGYDTRLNGHLSGAYANVNYQYNADLVLDFSSVAPVLNVGVQAGSWPQQAHQYSTTETAAGVQVTSKLTLPLDKSAAQLRAQVGLVHLESFRAWQLEGRLDAVLSQQNANFYGYRTRGARLAATALSSATPDGASQGAWLDGSYYLPLNALKIPGTAEFRARAGYRMSEPVSVGLDDYALFTTVGYRYTLDAEYLYGDGLYALESISFEPRLRSWFDGDIGVGADMSINADILLNYAAPISVGVTAGYADGFWYRFGVRLPF